MDDSIFKVNVIVDNHKFLFERYLFDFIKKSTRYLMIFRLDFNHSFCSNIDCNDVSENCERFKDIYELAFEEHCNGKKMGQKRFLKTIFGRANREERRYALRELCKKTCGVCTLGKV